MTRRDRTEYPTLDYINSPVLGAKKGQRPVVIFCQGIVFGLLIGAYAGAYFI
jgi:hypothetical protein